MNFFLSKSLIFWERKRIMNNLLKKWSNLLIHSFVLSDFSEWVMSKWANSQPWMLDRWDRRHETWDRICETGDVSQKMWDRRHEIWVGLTIDFLSYKISGMGIHSLVFKRIACFLGAIVKELLFCKEWREPLSHCCSLLKSNESDFLLLLFKNEWKSESLFWANHILDLCKRQFLFRKERLAL